MYEVLMQWDVTGQHKSVTGFFQFCSLQLLAPAPSTVPPVGQVPLLNSIAYNPVLSSSSGGGGNASVASRDRSNSRAGSSVNSTALPSVSELPPYQSLSSSKNMTPTRSIAARVLTTLQTIPTALGFLPRSDSLVSTVSVSSSVGGTTTTATRSDTKPPLPQSQQKSALSSSSEDQYHQQHSPQRRNSFGSLGSGPSGSGSGESYVESSRFPEATVIMAQRVTALSPDVSPARLAAYPTAVGFAVPNSSKGHGGAVPMDLFNRPFPSMQSNSRTQTNNNSKQSSGSAIVAHWGLCWTPYGTGRPVDYRHKDDMVVIQIESPHTSALIMTVFIPRTRVVQITLSQSAAQRLPSQQAQLVMRRQRGYSIDTPSQSQSLRSSRIEYSSEIHETSHILDESFSSGNNSLLDSVTRSSTDGGLMITGMNHPSYSSVASTSLYDDDEL